MMTSENKAIWVAMCGICIYLVHDVSFMIYEQFFLLFFWDRVSATPGWLGTCNPPISASQELGLQTCNTTSSPMVKFLFPISRRDSYHTGSFHFDFQHKINF
jgi:hypothetical protein